MDLVRLPRLLGWLSPAPLGHVALSRPLGRVIVIGVVAENVGEHDQVIVIPNDSTPHLLHWPWPVNVVAERGWIPRFEGHPCPFEVNKVRVSPIFFPP